LAQDNLKGYGDGHVVLKLNDMASCVFPRVEIGDHYYYI